MRLEDVTKCFGDVLAVDAVSLDVADREFMVLLGPSGCGKSTLLRLIAGLEDVTSGDVYIGGRRVNDVEPKRRDVAMVFQSYALYPHKSVQANIEFPLKARGVGRRARAQAAQTVAATLGLAEVLHRKPGALSGGQRQRVALARAIVRRPSVFCMDEPLSNLDAKLRGDTRAEITALHRRLEGTFVYVTHDQVEAMTMGTRIAVMGAGRIVQVGTPDEVYRRPATTFVAQFVGTPPMNMFPPGMVERGDHTVGVRPEDLRITDLPEGSLLPATVQLVEHLGHEMLVSCAVGSSGVPAVVRCAVRDDAPRRGDAVWLHTDEWRVHRFDTGTGARIAEGRDA